MEISPILIPIFAIIGGVIMVVLLLIFNNKERMAMIEKGLTPSVPTATPKTTPPSTLRFALLAIGAGLGLLIASFLETVAHMDEDVVFPAMILIFGGLGLLGSYVIQLKQEEKAKATKEREIERVFHEHV